MFAYGVVDVKESVPEAGVSASAISTTCLKLSADLGGSRSMATTPRDDKG
jgi:hypothetical protein